MRPNREATAVVPKPSHIQVNYLGPHDKLRVAAGSVGMLGSGKSASRAPSAPCKNRTLETSPLQLSANYTVRLLEAQTVHM